jgi:TolB protein
MKNLKSTSILKTLIKISYIKVLCLVIFASLISPDWCIAKIFIDINSPSLSKIRTAVPYFKNYTEAGEEPELSTALTDVIANDLDLSGYFLLMDRKAFLDEDGSGLTPDNIRFRNWSLIGTELLLKGGYTVIGRNIEVDIRLYDADWGTLVFGKKFLGKTSEYRHLMHRVGNEVIFALTGIKGMFLSRFAFVNNSTGKGEVYICDFDGHNPEQITKDDSIAMLPRWSPEGDSLAYNSFMEGSGSMLYIRDLATRKVKKVSGRKGLNTGARWLENGKALDLTLSFNGNPDIYTIDLDGKILQQLTRHWGIDISPSRSPDQNKIVFVSNRSGSPQIYVKDLNTHSEERLTFDLKYCTSPVWSVTDKIAFAAIEESGFDIYTMDSDGRNLKRLTEESGNNEDPCWSPDGRYIAFSSSRTGDSQIYIMNSNGGNQKRITFIKGEATTPSWSPY